MRCYTALNRPSCMQSVPRVAFFADSFHEVNGVALTSRQLDAFARRENRPFFSVHAGPEAFYAEGSVTTLQLPRGVASFALDADLSFDILMWQQHHAVEQRLRAFRPDLIHITGPSDIGILGLLLSRKLHLPLVGSWHTNLHEFAGRRLEQLLSFLPEPAPQFAGVKAEQGSFWATTLFYRAADVLLAPNKELVSLLKEKTGRPCFLMQRGVDTELFTPAKRQRSSDAFVLGYVGRLTSEKNVRLLARVEQKLIEAGITNYRFSIIGQGAEADWLRMNLRSAELPGVLKGDDLARAYANMDLFLFPSTSDTFGNVVQEALASGVPAVVTASGGPKYLVQDGETGRVCNSDEEFCRATLRLVQDEALHDRMRNAARHAALGCSWDSVFENQVYAAYRYSLRNVRSAAHH